jgi:hypothetical protein
MAQASLVIGINAKEFPEGHARFNMVLFHALNLC